MTQLYIHCPFCCHNIDLYIDPWIKLGQVNIGDSDVIQVTCENCGTTFTLISSEFYAKAHRGSCLKVDKCNMKGGG